MAHLDVAALHATLDRERERRGMSWRQVSRETGVSASTLSRMGQGVARPDVDGFATLVGWLGASADDFLRADGDGPAHEMSAPAAIAAHLRARRDLAPEDVDALEAIVRAAYERFRPHDST
ncbi:MAG: helix-turn-helix domain-containing protein [Egibacteraceae bacterium]